ncbi:MAG: S-layer homology domain-containing protein [Anaerolineales bacterium]|nr:S-layer homology domain-containing protein [Anaerolineales bacterium]
MPANISSLTITDSTITNNQAQTYGGGLYYGDPDGHTTIQNSVISGNQVINGGGGGLSTSGDLSIEDTTISGNSSLYDGGGISYYSDNKSFTLNRVTISGNSSINNAGGLYLLNTGTGSITNSTVSGNSSTNGVGGVFANASTSVLFNHVTIAGNTSTNYVGGLTTSGVNVSMKNSIIADNTGGGAFASFPDCLATIQSQDYNLIEKVDSNCGLTGITTHNITGQDPKLDTLKNNGGSTLTMGLLSGSPAIDPAGNTSCITEDQRGYSRPQDGDNNSTATCDIGALEVSGTPAVHVTRLDADPTSASSVRFLVRFTEPVNGVDKTAPFADFELSPIGLVGTSILSVTGSGAEYTVTVNTGTGNGSIGLDVGDNDSITSIASGEPLGGTGIGNGDYLNGERYTVDRIPPQVTTITRASTSPTNAANVDFTVTFSESVTGVGTSDFTLTTSGVSSAAVSGISGSGSSYTVTVNTGSGSGTIRLDVLNDNSIKDTGDNSLSAGYTSGPVYTIEKTAPSVLTSVRANANPTNLSSVDFTVTFSENVTGVDTSDFTLTTTGVSSAAVSGISGSGSSYTVTVNTGSGNGTIRLDVVNDGSIENATLNSLTAGFTNGEIYTVVKSATFSDVPLDYWANNYIERLYNAGITGGCVLSPLQYCPDTTVTRAQMAIFLLKGIHGSGYTPPAVNGTTNFADVATDHWAAAWIKQLAAEGITSGCGNGSYCPETTVTRAQMAIFLLKAKHGSSYSPAAATGVFNDVPVGYWADKWIEQLAVEGVTSGCGNGNYCPEADVTRAQMAIFLVKAFGLP